MTTAFNVTLHLLADSIAYNVEYPINTRVVANSDLRGHTTVNHTGAGFNIFAYSYDINELAKPWIREPQFIPLVVVYGLFFIVGITGNSLVIAVLCLGRAGNCVTFPCLVSMAWADVLFLMVCVPHSIVTYFISHWTLSTFLCKMSGFVENLSANATVLNLILISMER
ncbi:G-protein coupled receptor 54, partial [Biomphalaria pfeifferi]